MSDHASRVHLTAGVDVGSSAVKVAMARSKAGAEAEILSMTTHRIRRRDLAEVVRSAFDEACTLADVDPDGFDYVCSTGDADPVTMATGHFYGMTTHSRGAIHLAPDVRAVLDIGALHARAIRINDAGRVLQHRMTSQCASGSGQFLENIARYLGVPLQDVGELSVSAKDPEACSSICAVLAETDVINMVSRGISTPDILKGIHLSIARRLVALLRAIRADGTVLLTGGLAADVGMLAAINEAMQETAKKRRRRPVNVDVITHKDAIYAGAIGAALLAAYRYRQLQERGSLLVA
jgi:benzoyl-CoA reductase subunit D